MRMMILLFWLAAAIANTAAQESQIEVTKPTTAFDDARPNNDSIPEIYSVEGKFDHILVIRQKYMADLLQGLDRVVKEKNIRNAVILSGIGSVRGYHYHTVSNRTFPSKNIYVKNPSAPADILNINGYVIDGKVHAHVTLGEAGKAFGGHLERGTEVFTFAIVTLGVLPDTLNLTRLDDKTLR